MNTNNINNQFDNLPVEVADSRLSENQKKVLEVLYTYDSLNKTKENGYFFVTVDALMKESGIGSHHTIKNVLSRLIDYNFIQRTVGSFATKQASEYILNKEVIMEWCKSHQSIYGGTTATKTATRGATKTATSRMEEEIKELRAEVTELKAVIRQLTEKVTSLSLVAPLVAVPRQKCHTDTDTDIVYNKKNIINTKGSIGNVGSIRQDAANTGGTTATKTATSVEEINNTTSSSAMQQNEGTTSPTYVMSDFEIDLSELTLLVEQHNATPTSQLYGEVKRQMRKIDNRHQQDGVRYCSDKQYRLAIYHKRRADDIYKKQNWGTTSATSTSSLNNSTTDLIKQPTEQSEAYIQYLNDNLSNSTRDDVDFQYFNLLISEQSKYTKYDEWFVIYQTHLCNNDLRREYLEAYYSNVTDISEDFIARRKDEVMNSLGLLNTNQICATA